MTKIEAIVAGLEEHLGLTLVEFGGGDHKLVKKSRQNCRHRDTSVCKHCGDPANVTCQLWQYDRLTPKLCDVCYRVYHSDLKSCPHCPQSSAITDHLVRCSHVGEDTMCINCYHSSPHVAINLCSTEGTGDYCKYIDSNIKCIPIKEVTNHA